MGKRSLLLSLFFLIVLSSFAVADLSDDIIVYYTMDNADIDGTNMHDLNDNVNATLTNSPDTGVVGILGEAVNFTKGSNQFLDPEGAIALDDSFTLCYWAKTTTVGVDYESHFRFSSTNGYVRELSRKTEGVYQYDYKDDDASSCSFNIDYTSYVDDTYHFICLIRNGTTVDNDCSDELYIDIDGNRVAWTTDTGTANPDNTMSGDVANYIGRDTESTRGAGTLDEFIIYDVDIGKDNRDLLYNGGSGCNPIDNPTGCTPAPAANVTAPFEINASSIYTPAVLITNFNATIDGTNKATTNGTINSGLYQNSSILHNVTIYAENYLTVQYQDLNVSTNLAGLLTPIGLHNITLSNYTTLIGSGDYVRQLVYTYNYTCDSGGSANLLRYIDNSLNLTTALTCDNTTQTATQAFTLDYEGHFNTSLVYTTTIGSSNSSTANLTFFSDLYAPQVVNTSFAYGTDFVDPAANFSMHCNDTVTPNLTYTMTFNGVIYADEFKPKLSQLFNESIDLVDGFNNVTYACADYFGTDNTTTQTDINIRTLFMIDEQKNEAFDVQNLSSVIVYLDDNRTSYDFKTNAKNNISFIADQDVKLRFELIYADGTIILRYVDIGLIDDDIRVCANTEGITHYEQILTSSTSRPVVLKSVFADCTVAADYTRFAYQNSKVLKAYTYNNLYYLYTFVDDDITKNQIFLASVDGSIATYINLDSLEFFDAGYSIDAIGDGIAVNKLNANEMAIYYYNTLQDNTDLQIQIVRLDTDVTLYNVSAFADNNEASITFNYAALANVNTTTVFRVDAIATTDNGVTTLSKYFNTNGVTGSISAGLMFIISVIFYIFGLSFASTSRTFSYIGLIVMAANIAILSFATAAWYVTFMQAINAITLVYIFFIMTGKNTVQVG